RGPHVIGRRRCGDERRATASPGRAERWGLGGHIGAPMSSIGGGAVMALRVVCYVNQFFGQLGGEEKAGVGPHVVDGAVGAARAVQQALGDAGTVVATVICGDNYAAEHTDRAAAELVAVVAAARPDLVIAGPAFPPGPAPRLLKTLEGATIALVTDGGLVPRGNPDGIEALNATRYGAYSIEGKTGLDAAQYDNPHRGYDTTWVKQDPNRLVPVDVARELEQSGAIGKLHETVYSTVGVATTLAHSARMGQEIAEKLRAAGVDAVILTST